MALVKLTCSFCKREFERDKKQIDKRYKNYFCSIECQAQHRSDKYTLVRYAHSSARRRAKADNIYFDVSIEYALELWEKQKGICVLTGEKLSFGSTRYEKRHGFTTASLDRIDSSGSYSIGNVQWIHKVVQKMKFDLPEQSFKCWCRRVADWSFLEQGLTDCRATEYNNSTSDDYPPF